FRSVRGRSPRSTSEFLSRIPRVLADGSRRFCRQSDRKQHASLERRSHRRSGFRPRNSLHESSSCQWPRPDDRSGAHDLTSSGSSSPTVDGGKIAAGVMKILIIGIDGLSLERIVADERLDNFRRFMDAGVFGKLQSVLPATPIPAWLSMMSSQDPGSLGVY